MTEDSFQDQVVNLVRAFGWHRPTSTPCGQPVHIAEAHALPELSKSESMTQRELALSINLAPGAGGGAMGRWRRFVKARISITLCAVVPTAACGSAERSVPLEERQAAVAEIGARVMPFDLEKTTHVFEKIENGGRQVVRADSDDPEQVRLVRGHLSEEATRFSKGDFHDPGTIHGDDMAGLHQLVTGYQRIRIEYSEVDRGAQIVYTTDDRELVRAIHDWFDAQVLDHGGHAQPHE